MIAVACFSLTGAGFAQSLPNLEDGASISMECALAIKSAVEDLEIHYGREAVNAFGVVKCVEVDQDKVIVWVQPVEYSTLTRGGGYLYEIEHGTRRVMTRKPQR
ncbi:MAG: hypothetical protein AAF996_00255 [Pseudomonadota bacterium]